MNLSRSFLKKVNFKQTFGKEERGRQRKMLWWQRSGEEPLRSEGIVRVVSALPSSFSEGPICSFLPSTRLFRVKKKEEAKTKVNISAGLPWGSTVNTLICKKGKDLSVLKINHSCQVSASSAYTKLFILAQTGCWFSADAETEWSSNQTTTSFLCHLAPTTPHPPKKVKIMFNLKKSYQRCPVRNQRTAFIHSLGKTILNSF